MPDSNQAAGRVPRKVLGVSQPKRPRTHLAPDWPTKAKAAALSAPGHSSLLPNSRWLQIPLLFEAGEGGRRGLVTVLGGYSGPILEPDD